MQCNIANVIPSHATDCNALIAVEEIKQMPIQLVTGTSTRKQRIFCYDNPYNYAIYKINHNAPNLSCLRARPCQVGSYTHSTVA